MLLAVSPSVRIRSPRSCCRSTHSQKAAWWHGLNRLITREYRLNGVSRFLLSSRLRAAAVSTFFGMAGNRFGILSVTTKPSKCLRGFYSALRHIVISIIQLQFTFPSHPASRIITLKKYFYYYIYNNKHLFRVYLAGF